ncbi:MAG: long-chain-acyl-CoA synthetase [Pseudomonadales bacterium]|nr:long-chain-acyl-CoA synthetase [Pseudomonadales bacterium]
MDSNNSDLITWQMLLRKTPEILKNLPTMVKGLKMGNITDPTLPVGLGLCWENAVDSNPNGLAFLYEDSRFTYHEFNMWANQVSHYFISKGIQKGDVVALMIENRPELMLCVIGLTKIGAASAMINTQQNNEVLIHSLNLVKPKHVIVGSELVDIITAAKGDLDIEDGGYYCIADQDTSRDPGEVPEGYLNLITEIKSCATYNPDTTHNIFINDPCFYIYTSGTTGMPKAGIFKHGRWMKSFGGLSVSTVKLKPGDILYCSLPLYHASGLIVCWGSALAGQAGLAIRRKFSASNFWSDVRRYNANAFGYIGELCRYLMTQPERPDDRLNPIKIMLGNGLRPAVWKQFKERYDIDTVYEFYGASDGNIGFINMLNFDNTVGFTVSPYAIVEYDKDTDQPVKGPHGFLKKLGKGEAGLLLAEISDKTPLDGYTDEEKTKKVIMTDVFKKGDRWFNTGDMIRDIGFNHAQFVDRLGDTYRWKGENVSTTEIENLIANYPKIDEVVAYGVEIPDTNGRAGMASITPNVKIEDFDFKHFYSYLKSSMPQYAVPVFIRIKTTMDTTGTFKYKKSDLKNEAYDITQTDEPIYAILPGDDTFIPVTEKLREEIDGGHYRF